MLNTEMPDIPPFLRVDAAEAKRRHEWWEANPPRPATFMGGSDGKLDADKRADTIAYLKEHPIVPDGPRVVKVKAKPVYVDRTGFHWDTRRGRFIPDGYEPPRRLTAPITPEEAKLTAALLERNAKRPLAKDKARAEAKQRNLAVNYGNTPPAKAAPVKLDGRSAESPGKKAEGESNIDCIIRLLKRKEGATLAECGAACGLQAHTVQARLADTVKRKLNHIVNRYAEPVGNVFRIEE